MNEFNLNILRTVLPFYSDIEHQNRYKSWCKDDMRGFFLITPRSRFLPFQFIRAADPGTDYTWELYSAIDNSLYTTINFPPGQIDTATKGAYDYITYFGSEDFFTDFDCGLYYIKWTDGTYTKYSEVFYIKDFTDDTLDNLLKYNIDELIIINSSDDKIKIDG